MALLVDLFGYLTLVLHGLAIAGQSVALGGTLFLLLLARPLAPVLGVAGPRIVADTRNIAAWAALALAVVEAASLALNGALLSGTVGLSAGAVLSAGFAIAALVRIGAAALLGLALFRPRAPAWLLLAAGTGIVAAAAVTTHAAARLDGRVPLLAATALHQLGAAIWIGGIPAFVAALARLRGGEAVRAVGRRFSRMSMAGVAAILLSGVGMSLAYIGDWSGFYGTAYGVMVAAKIGLFLMLLALGAGNFLLVERLRADPRTPVLRLRRFAEAEIGIGVAVFFAAASLTSVPPATDLTDNRASWADIVDRNTPHWPRLASPDHDDLALPALQARLDQEQAASYTPGSGEAPPRNAADIAWSEYNHHWAGLFVLAIGLAALLDRAGLRWARHWPLLFLGMAGFLFVRSDPEVWPLGQVGFFASLRDVEVLQHRAFVLAIVVFGLFEWGVRTGWRYQPAAVLAGPGSATLARGGFAPAAEGGGAALVFPLVTAVGGTLLLTHTHAVNNVREQLLIELTHTPLALLGTAAGWARWLELRLGGREGRIAGWLWPVCFVLVGALLVLYREA